MPWEVLPVEAFDLFLYAFYFAICFVNSRH